MTLLRTQFVNAFIQAAEEAFGTAVGLPLKRTGAQLSPSNRILADFAAVIGLKGLFRSRMALGMERALAETLRNAMAGDESAPEQSDPETDPTADAVCELVNLTAGGAKTRLGGTAYAFDIGIPGIAGKGAALLPSPAREHIVISFDVDGREMILQLCIEVPTVINAP